MSFVMSVQTSLPCAHACDEGMASSRSDAWKSASIVAMVCSSSSRTAACTVAAIGASPPVEPGHSRSVCLDHAEAADGPCTREGLASDEHSLAIDGALAASLDGVDEG